jgi:hypothetical protein
VQGLTRADLLGLEQYAVERPRFRAEVMAHKRKRILGIGPHVSLHFEDRLTVQYQIQEMLRVERIFEREAIEAEIETYNPLIPDGTNLKATMMLEYEDPTERSRALALLIGVEDRVWLRVDDYAPVFAIADEDLARDTAEKTASVHFLRFELDPEMRVALRGGAGLCAGIDHDAYRHALEPIPSQIRDALLADLD